MSARTHRPPEIPDNTSGSFMAARPFARLMAALCAIRGVQKPFVPVSPPSNRPRARKAWCRLDPA